MYSITIAVWTTDLRLFFNRFQAWIMTRRISSRDFLRDKICMVRLSSADIHVWSSIIQCPKYYTLLIPALGIKSKVSWAPKLQLLMIHNVAKPLFSFILPA